MFLITSPASYAGGRNVRVNGGDNTSYTFNNLVKNTPYFITVQGLTRDGRKSICSNQVLIKTSTAGRWYIANWVSIIKSSNIHMRSTVNFVSCLLAQQFRYLYLNSSLYYAVLRAE